MALSMVLGRLIAYWAKVKPSLIQFCYTYFTSYPIGYDQNYSIKVESLKPC